MTHQNTASLDTVLAIKLNSANFHVDAEGD